MKTEATCLWMRLGDTDEYHRYDDIEGVAEAMREASVHGPFKMGHPMSKGMLYAPGYEACNYISLFWGDEDAEFVRTLTKEELNQIGMWL